MGDTIAQTRFENVSKLSNDPLLARGNTLRSGEDRLKLKELMEFCTKLQQRVLDLENTELLKLRRLQDMAKKEINVAEKEVSTTDPVTTAGEVVTTACVEISIAKPTKTTINDDLTLAQTLIEIRSAKPKVIGVVIGEQSESTTRTRPQQLPSKDKGKAIMEELEKPTKIKDQIRHDEEVAQRLQAQMQAELEEEDRLLEQENAKKQKVDDDKETTELKNLMEVMPDEEDVTLDYIPLAVKSPSIIDWKILKEGKKSYYKIIRADESSKMYLVFSHMLKSFDREDLETLHKLVKAKYGSTRHVEDLDLVLYGDFKTMFEPHVENNVWKNQSDYRVLDRKLY
ncbi:hypothetical protein Tco_0695439 [Tanacetum coccineum]